MRRVLKDTSEVCHYWANQSQSDGCNKTRSVFFEGPKIYSYGRHFCMARILPSGVVAQTTRRYSITTSKHLGEMRSAVRHLDSVYCHNPGSDVLSNMEHARSDVLQSLMEARAPRIRQTTRVALRARALNIAQQANAYLAALPEDERYATQPIDTTELESAAVELAAARAAEARIRAERHAAHLADLQADLTLWRAGEIITRTGLSNLPCALRLNADRSRIQTSWGAEIDAKHAPALWRMIERTRASGAEITTSVDLGPYKLSRINPDGSIVVGCHNITYSELASIAQQLGYTTEHATC